MQRRPSQELSGKSAFKLVTCRVSWRDAHVLEAAIQDVKSSESRSDMIEVTIVIIKADEVSHRACVEAPVHASFCRK
jgi:hypothetical protein